MAAFPDIKKIPYEGPDSKNPLAFRHYNEDELVEGKSMKDHLRFSVAYWHTLRGTGSDPFGPGTMLRPWEGGSRLGRERHQARARGLRVHREARRPVLLLPRPRRRPRRRDACAETNKQPRRGRQGPQGRAAAHRHQAAVGHGQPVQQSRATCTARPPAATPTSSPTPPPR